MKTTINRRGERSGHKAHGFTLIEMMIVVVIIGALLLIGLPAYRDQIIRGHRAAAKAEMLEIANRQHQFMLANRSFASKTILETNGLQVEAEVEARYSWDISTAQPANAPFFIINFTAIGDQLADGDLSLNSEGVGEPPEKWNR